MRNIDIITSTSKERALLTFYKSVHPRAYVILSIKKIVWTLLIYPCCTRHALTRTSTRISQIRLDNYWADIGSEPTSLTIDSMLSIYLKRVRTGSGSGKHTTKLSGSILLIPTCNTKILHACNWTEGPLSMRDGIKRAGSCRRFTSRNVNSHTNSLQTPLSIIMSHKKTKDHQSMFEATWWGKSQTRGKQRTRITQ